MAEDEDSKDVLDRLSELESRVKAQESCSDFILKTYQLRWERFQQQLRSLYLLYKENAAGDSKTREMLNVIRSAQKKLHATEHQKYQLMHSDSENVKKRVEVGERKHRNWLKRSGRMNIALIFMMFVIFILYLKDELAAGEMLDAWITILSAGGATFFGFSAMNSKEDE